MQNRPPRTDTIKVKSRLTGQHKFSAINSVFLHPIGNQGQNPTDKQDNASSGRSILFSPTRSKKQGQNPTEEQENTSALRLILFASTQSRHQRQNRLTSGTTQVQCGQFCLPPPGQELPPPGPTDLQDNAGSVRSVLFASTWSRVAATQSPTALDDTSVRRDYLRAPRLPVVTNAESI